MNITKDQLIKISSLRFENAQVSISKFAAKLAIDPLHAFSWGDSVVQAAAQVTVYSTILSLLESADVEDVKKETLREVMRAARHPACSSSVMSNLSETYKAQVWAQVLEDLS